MTTTQTFKINGIVSANGGQKYRVTKISESGESALSINLTDGSTEFLHLMDLDCQSTSSSEK